MLRTLGNGWMPYAHLHTSWDSHSSRLVQMKRSVDRAIGRDLRLNLPIQAQQALTYLDDHLKTEYNIRDMVDTTLAPPNVDMQHLEAALANSEVTRVKSLLSTC